MSDEKNVFATSAKPYKIITVSLDGKETIYEDDGSWTKCETVYSSHVFNAKTLEKIPAGYKFYPYVPLVTLHEVESSDIIPTGFYYQLTFHYRNTQALQEGEDNE